jgi:catechol-2,3-dioxygenase
MTIAGLNHAVLFVRDAQRSADFYREVLGFTVVHELAGGIFLRADGSTNDHDLAVFPMGPHAGATTAGKATVGLYHLAWEVRTLGALKEYAERLAARGALVGASDHHSTKGVYAKDPDGLEFELTWVVPADLLGGGPASTAIRPLDIDKEIARFGADTPGASTRGTPVG